MADESASDFPIVSPDKIPKLKRVDSQIAFDWKSGEFYGTGMRERFYVRWSGAIKARKRGVYTFYTESDDGSRLFIDGKQVVDNQGLHSMQEEDGAVELSSGWHRIKIEFIQYDGGAGCICRWKQPKGEKEIIPENMLSHALLEEDPGVKTSVAFETNRTTREAPPEPPEDALLDDKVKSVLPRPEEENWQSIPWKRNLQDARRESQLQGKPLFLWIMNGNPNGCT